MQKDSSKTSGSGFIKSCEKDNRLWLCLVGIILFILLTFVPKLIVIAFGSCNLDWFDSIMLTPCKKCLCVNLVLHSILCSGEVKSCSSHGIRGLVCESCVAGLLLQPSKQFYDYIYDIC
jgi:hypothetical protein